VTTPPADTVWANFTDDAPWVLDRSDIAWDRVAVVLRDNARREVPRLIKRRRTPPLGRLVVVVAVLGWAIAPWWIRKKRGRFGSPEQSRAHLSLRLRRAIERLGATYIKLAQIISSGEGLFPAELVDEFKRCRDQVPAEPWDKVRLTVEQDLGARIDQVFSSFDRTALAAASIAQVHAATLLTGEEVVVKVQRPTVSSLVRKDLTVMAWLAPFLIGRIPVAALANPPALVELFAETIVEELDFRMEAANMVDVAGMLHELDQAGYVVPRPHPRLVTRRILVMQRLRGFNFDDVAGMRAAGIDTEAVNKKRLAFMRLMLGATTNDLRGQVKALCDLGALPQDTDIDAVIRDLGLDQPTVDPTTLSGEELVREVQRIVKALLAYGAKLPKELMLYVKNMVFLDGAIARLAPDLDIIGELTSISMTFMQRHGMRLAQELGVNPDDIEIDMGSLKAGLGVSESTETLTYRQLQERRDLINRRMRDHIGI
jgi:ubiquinone biosynthesis protein